MWDNKWQADFDEKNVENTGVTWLKGRMFYDYDNLQYRIDRDNGRSDRFCGTTYDKNTPCSHIVKDSIFINLLMRQTIPLFPKHWEMLLLLRC